MSAIKNKSAFTIIVLLAVSVYAADEIDINSITKSNPFARFTPRQISPGGASVIDKPDLVVETATLKFLDAKSVKSSIQNMAGSYGNIETDENVNALIICDTRENADKILEQIRKIDRKPDQVMIEVVILDVKLDNGTEIGVNWDMLTNDYRDAVYRQNLTFSNRLQSVPGITDTGTRNFTNIGNSTAFNSVGTAGDFWLIMGDIRAVIHALQQKNKVEILASPRVMVVSGQTASIESVEEIPFSELSQTSEGGQLTSTQFKNVGVTLDIGATLTDDKYILLNVESGQKVRTGTSVDGVPIVDARVVKSSLLLEDGQTLVIGGLRRKEMQKQTNQIPFLGDIPVLGLAFKATNTVENNSELLIILSPHIYAGEKPTAREMRKYNEITKRPLLTISEFEEEKTKKEEAAKLTKKK
ncbi:MAG: putative type II secretion system protein D precursor [Planctomycetes bacterium ADurb.Bin401]|nr:MAG: putative type II secretion system protein D precursor [Planctomycetes bacterium ADurb.Bin401]